MTKSQNIPAILMTYLNMQKTFMKTFTPRKCFQLCHRLLNKIPTDRKISRGHLNLCEAEISLDEITKAIISEKKQ